MLVASILCFRLGRVRFVVRVIGQYRVFCYAVVWMSLMILTSVLIVQVGNIPVLWMRLMVLTRVLLSKWVSIKPCAGRYTVGID